MQDLTDRRKEKKKGRKTGETKREKWTRKERAIRSEVDINHLYFFKNYLMVYTRDIAGLFAVAIR